MKKRLNRLRWLLVAAVSTASGCTTGGAPADTGVRTTVTRCAPPSGPPTWQVQSSSASHQIDGRFGSDEWADVPPLQGMYTDVYIDYANGSLYLLNDWRSNTEGVTLDCYNQFLLTLPNGPIDLRVYGDGRVEVIGDAATRAEGAYGFGPSPVNATPHTIYEFRLELPVEGQVDICCLDPVARSTCRDLTAEPAVFSINARGGTTGGVSVARRVRAEAPRLAEDDACGAGQGICAEGLTCISGQCARAVPRTDGGVEGDAGVAVDGGSGQQEQDSGPG